LFVEGVQHILNRFRRLSQVETLLKDGRANKPFIEVEQVL